MVEVLEILHLAKSWGIWAYSQLGYLKGWSNGKRIGKDYFGFLLHLIFHDYSGLVHDYN